MPADVLAHARAVLPRMQADFQQLLSELHKQLEDNKRKAAELEETQSEMKRRQADLEKDALRRERERQREWTQLSEEAGRQLRRPRPRHDGPPERGRGTAQSRGTGPASDRKDTARIPAGGRERHRSAGGRAQAVPRLVLEEGAKVRLKDVRGVATVRRILKNGLIEVEAGFLKMQIPREDIVESSRPAVSRGCPKTFAWMPVPIGMSPTAS